MKKFKRYLLIGSGSIIAPISALTISTSPNEESGNGGEETNDNENTIDIGEYKVFTPSLLFASYQQNKALMLKTFKNFFFELQLVTKHTPLYENRTYENIVFEYEQNMSGLDIWGWSRSFIYCYSSFENFLKSVFYIENEELINKIVASVELNTEDRVTFDFNENAYKDKYLYDPTASNMLKEIENNSFKIKQNVWTYPYFPNNFQFIFHNFQHNSPLYYVSLVEEEDLKINDYNKEKFFEIAGYYPYFELEEMFIEKNKDVVFWTSANNEVVKLDAKNYFFDNIFLPELLKTNDVLQTIKNLQPSLENDNSTKEVENSELKEENQRLRSENQQKQERINELEAENEIQKQSIATLENTIANLTKELEELKNSNNQKDATITNQSNKIEELETQIAQQNRVNEELEAQLEQLAKELSNFASLLEQLKSANNSSELNYIVSNSPQSVREIISQILEIKQRMSNEEKANAELKINQKLKEAKLTNMVKAILINDSVEDNIDELLVKAEEKLTTSLTHLREVEAQEQKATNKNYNLSIYLGVSLALISALSGISILLFLLLLKRKNEKKENK